MIHLLLLVAAAVADAPGGASQEVPMPTSIAPRDGNIAIQEELDAARRKGTLDAYDLFIARHPDHPLAEIARREREALERRRKSARHP